MNRTVSLMLGAAMGAGLVLAAVVATAPETPASVFPCRSIVGLCDHVGIGPDGWVFEAGNEEDGNYVLEGYATRFEAIKRLDRASFFR